ncbi:50S ribosomal protein L14e [Candidatus Woesearchaeota archaeon]|nr:50S ribosomal protein L14e [Candidatus Woesearchaeota archaeon]
MYEVGRLCVKLAGRDAGGKCVVVDVLDSTYVMIDGQTRRRKCNIKHLEPLDIVLKLKKNASHEDVADLLRENKIEVQEKKPKAEKPAKEPKKKAVKKKEIKASKKEPKAKKKSAKKA